MVVPCISDIIQSHINKCASYDQVCVAKCAFRVGIGSNTQCHETLRTPNNYT